MMKIFLLTLCATISSIWAYSAGAPEGVCDDMTPKHPVPPQRSALPYKVSVSKNQIAPGGQVDITIGGKAFKGFLLEVRKGDKAVGAFDISPSDKYIKPINCHGTPKSGATHKNSNEKKDLVIKWTAPKEPGSYVVYATVAEDGGTFWVRKPTETIKVN